MNDIHTDQYEFLEFLASFPKQNSSFFSSSQGQSILRHTIASMDIISQSSIAQAAIAGTCLFIYITRDVFPRAPQWIRPFAKEEVPSSESRTRSYSFWTFCLLALSAIGFVLAILVAVSPPFNIIRILELSPWVVALFITILGRPRKTPKTLLTLFTTTTVCGLVSLVAWYNETERVNIIHVASVGVALATIFLILSMPLRDPSLGPTGIANSTLPPTSQLRSPEDNLSLWQFMTVSWLSPLITKGSESTLNDEDVWVLPYEFQHERLHLLFRDLKGTIIKRLLLANGLDLFIITFLGIVETTANLANPALLERLLKSIERGPNDTKESVFYALAILFVRLVAAQSSVFQTWYSRRAYERSRGELLTAVYAKTLSRKSFGLRTDLGEPSRENGHNSTEETPLIGNIIQPEKTRVVRLLEFLRLRKSKDQRETEVNTEQPATMGKILNLMRNDAYEVAQRFWEFPSLLTKPLQLVFSLLLIWQLLGWPCLFGVAWAIILQLLNGWFIRSQVRVERRRRAATDVRLQATTQFVEAIRPLRWYDWQSKWLGNIMQARAKELHLRVITSLWSIGVNTSNLAAGALFPVFTFFAVTYIAGRPLPVHVAFPALSLFGLLESSLKELPGLITVLINASLAIERLETFMREPDKEERDYNDIPSEIEFQGASFAWPTNGKLVLEDLNLQFPPGLTLIHGKVGSGKTAFLEAILGELDQVKGNCSLPNEMVGYCAQSPWLQNMSIRDNILFNFPMDRIRYNEVIDACELIPDLANFPHGDKSNIGENGIGLSGGQKARVALARAVYCRSRFLLLDDPLAALDHSTAQSIVSKLFHGSLLKGRTVILVTHRVDLCLALADQVVEITNGTARVFSSNEYPGEFDSPTQNRTNVFENGTQEVTDDLANAAVPDKFISEETRASGGVLARVYWTYIRAGKLTYWFSVIGIFALFRFARVFNYWFLKAWGEGYGSVEAQAQAQTSGLSDIPNRIFDGLPSPEEDVRPWLVWYTVIGIILTTLYLFTQCGIILILYRAAKNLFIRVINQVSSATFRFYDTTPVGRLMNRLTSDIGMLDGGVIQPLQNSAFWSLTWLVSMVVIALTTPVFFIFAIAMTIWFIVIFRWFLPTSQNLRRLEMVTLSPLMSNFGILADGLATIRAFKAQSVFQNRNIAATDTFQKMDHFYWSLQSWLQYRYDILSAGSIFVLTILGLYQGLSSGLIAFVLTSATQFVEATHVLCKTYGQLQMDFVSVERVVELLDLEEEPNGDIEPPPDWPSYQDSITFDSVTIKYAPHLEPSLVDVSFTIPSGATCAVLGRTGSGKSTLALALLATMHPTEGQIRVGKHDISKVDVHTWRQRISFVAQDPVLFPGTIRENLDPMEQHTDEECQEALFRVLGPKWYLDSIVDVGGKNLSQGQRQLVGIGRAILRKSPIIILDEATASIDKKTALAIQDVLLAELRDSTVITIAHRLEAVKDADYFIRLDAGRVVEAGPAGGRK